jgi:uncharacterized RDD family membrane protein YckC
MLYLARPSKRLGSYFLDALISALVLLLFNLIIVFSNSDPLIASATVARLVLNLSYLGVQIYFWTKGQSIGKHILGLKVIDSFTGEQLSFGKMALRETIGKFISGFVFCLGYFWILTDNDNQGWHDKLVDSKVMVMD